MKIYVLILLLGAIAAYAHLFGVATHGVKTEPQS